MHVSFSQVCAAELHRQDLLARAARERQTEHAPVTHLLARYPVLVSPLVMSGVAAVAALVAGLLLGVQDASAGAIIHSGPRR